MSLSPEQPCSHCKLTPNSTDASVTDNFTMFVYVPDYLMWCDYLNRVTGFPFHLASGRRWGEPSSD